jgi:hypothetical protein
MQRFQHGLIVSLLSLSSIGTAGMLQDPSRVRLLGPLCGKLDPVTVVKFDAEGRLAIDMSQLPPLGPEQKKTVCQIKIPFSADNKAMNGSWQMQAQYHQAHGSSVLATVRFSGVGEVGRARTWQVSEGSEEPLTWSEAYEVEDDGKEEDELKITWTAELQIPPKPADAPPTSTCRPSFQIQQLLISPVAPTVE